MGIAISTIFGPVSTIFLGLHVCLVYGKRLTKQIERKHSAFTLFPTSRLSDFNYGHVRSDIIYFYVYIAFCFCKSLPSNEIYNNHLKQTLENAIYL